MTSDRARVTSSDTSIRRERWRAFTYADKCFVRRLVNDGKSALNTHYVHISFLDKYEGVSYVLQVVKFTQWQPVIRSLRKFLPF